MKWIPLAAAAFALALHGCGGCGGGGGEGEILPKELVSQNIERKGDTWYLSFVSKIDAPVDKVYDAFSKPEMGHDMAPENILKSEVVSEEGNKKVVDIVIRLDILPPGFKVQNIRQEYVFFPDQKRFTTRSIDFKLADMNSEYRFEPAPDGKGTLVKFTQTSKDKAPLLLESLQKGALRETFVTTVRVISKSLGLGAPPEAKS